MSDQDREVVVETTTVETAPPELQSLQAGVTQPPPVAADTAAQPLAGLQVMGQATEQAEPVGITSAGPESAQQSPPTGTSQPSSTTGPSQQSPSTDNMVAADPVSVGTESIAAAPASPASATLPSAAPVTDPSDTQPIPQLERLSISETSTESIVESPAVMSPLAARPPFERTETGSTNESRKHTALPGLALPPPAPVAHQTDGLLSPISAGPSLLSSTYSLRKGTADSGRTMRGARHWSRDDVPPHSPDEGLGKESMVIQCDEDESEEDACHGTVSKRHFL